MLIPKIRKLSKILLNPAYRRALLRFGVAAGTEHQSVLQQLPFAWVVDIGANCGQFALVARGVSPTANIWAFEPQAGPARKFRNCFSRDPLVHLSQCAIGSQVGTAKMFISGHADSSSLLPIGKLQSDTFRGTEEVGRSDVTVSRLSHQLPKMRPEGDGLMKIDVQGFELEVLKGSADVLGWFSWIYVESSLVEFYERQATLRQLVEFLLEANFELRAIHNPYSIASIGIAQADFLFVRKSTCL